MKNLKWVKNDLVNARSTVAMMNVKSENVYEFVNSTWEEIDAADKELNARLLKYFNAGDTVFIYAYIAGHGCADVRQFLLLNTSDPKKAMYNIEEKLRKKSLVSNGKCFIFAVYDVCRLQKDADKIKQLLAEGKAA